jgi:hypothetical protein
MDAQDKQRTLSNKEKALAYLKAHGSVTNHRLRSIAGSRCLARIWELQREGHDISVRKLDRSTWEIRLNMKPLGRDAGTRVEQKTLFELS